MGLKLEHNLETASQGQKALRNQAPRWVTKESQWQRLTRRCVAEKISSCLGLVAWLVPQALQRIVGMRSDFFSVNTFSFELDISNVSAFQTDSDHLIVLVILQLQYLSTNMSLQVFAYYKHGKYFGQEGLEYSW